MIYRPLVLKKIVLDSKKWWMDSDGQLIECVTTHLLTAINLTKDINDPIGILWRRGWQRVCNYPNESLYCENELTPPNDVQKSKLIELAKEYGQNQVVFDIDDKKQFVIWSKDNVL